MVTTNKLHELYNEIKNTNTKEFCQMISESETIEESEFFNMLADVMLKQKRRKVIITEVRNSDLHMV